MFWRRKQASRGRDPAANPTPTSGLFNPRKLDLISATADLVILIIIQDEPWTGSPAELDSLGQKLSMYVAFMLEGHVDQKYPELAGRRWCIVIDSYTGRPSSAVMAALHTTGDDIRSRGGELIFHELEPPPPGQNVPRSIRAIRLHTDVGAEDLVPWPPHVTFTNAD